MHARTKSLLTLHQIINKPDFPSLADEIAELCPDMNIKVAAFTVSEESINSAITGTGHLTLCLDDHILHSIFLWCVDDMKGIKLPL